MHRFTLLFIVFLAGVASCKEDALDPAILGTDVTVRESLRPLLIGSKIVGNQLQVDIVPEGPSVCCCAPCPQFSYANTAKYEIQIAYAESGPYSPYTTIKIGDKEADQLKTQSFMLPDGLSTQPVIVRVVAISQRGQAGYVGAIMNSTSPISTPVTEVAVAEKDELLSLAVSPVRSQAAYVTYVQDAALNVVPTLRLADYKQGQLLNARVISPGGFAPAFSRDGRQLIYFLPYQTTNSSQSLIIRDLIMDNSWVIQFPTDLWLTSPTWSPDGQWIGFLEQNNEHTRLWKLNVTHGNLEPVTPDMPYKEPGGIWQGSIDWSPDGRAISVTRNVRVADSWRHGISLISPDNGTFLSDLTTLAGWTDKTPAYSPNGQNITFVSSRTNMLDNRYTIWVRNLTANQLRHIRLPDFYQLSDNSLPRWVDDNTLLITAYAGNSSKPHNLLVSL